jgi:endonuclease G
MKTSAARPAPDEDLPKGFKVVEHKDYVNSGFDRGHMCPHSDRAHDEEMSKATFVLTNIVPQSPDNNEKGWKQLEDYCRSLVEKQDKELYIVSGPEGRGGEGKKGFIKSIGTRLEPEKIIVPATTWKVVLVLNRGGRVDQTARLIAVIVPNDQTVGEDWARYRVPVKQVEKLTGYKFFDRADPAVLDPMKEKADAESIR